MRKLSIAFTVFLFSAFGALAQDNTFPTDNPVGIKTLSPTHSLTLGSTATGIAAYNTPDQATHFERARFYWSGNVFTMVTEAGVGDIIRNMAIGTQSRRINIYQNSSAAGFFQIGSNTSSTNLSVAGITGNLSPPSGTVRGLAIVNTLSPPTGSTAGYQALWISPFESSPSTGPEYLIDAGTNSAANGTGTHTSRFFVSNTGNGYFAGNVGIGIANPPEALAVKGTIHSQKVVIDMNGWGDYVFDEDYKLPSLQFVKNYIAQNHHLPDVPSVVEVVGKGLDVSEMNKILIKKVEELTLYLIEKDRQVTEQQKTNKSLQEQIDFLMDQSKLKMPASKAN